MHTEREKQEPRHVCFVRKSAAVCLTNHILFYVEKRLNNWETVLFTHIRRMKRTCEKRENDNIYNHKKTRNLFDVCE